MGIEERLARLVSKFVFDPLGFVEKMFPWGEGILKGETGPEDWQADFLAELGIFLRERKREPFYYAVSSGHDVGKSLANGEPVLTPSGWVAVENLKVGDLVIAVDGKPTKVVGVFPQGRRDIFRVKFNDGCFLDVDGDHRWFTTTRSERKHDQPGKIRATSEIAGSLYFPNRPVRGLNHRIPTVEPVEHRKASLPIEPYLFGCWLGDGDPHGRITGEDQLFKELIKAGVNFGAETRDKRRPNVISRTPLGIAPKLRKIGLFGCRSYEKRINQPYLFASKEQRICLLQGLLDTDGTIQKNGAIIFGTVSLMLAEDMGQLVRSLGGIARKSSKQGVYNDKKCRLIYMIYITLPKGIVPCRLKAKLERYKPKFSDGNSNRWRSRFISSVEYIGKLEATCIKIDHPTGLFVAKDYIVTHNTALVAWLILWFQSTRPHPQNPVTANTKTQLETKTWRELAKWWNLSLNKHWFDWTASKFYLKKHPETWFASAIPWSKERAEAFAGTHEKYVLMIFDEASAIDDSIWEVASGAMLEPGAIWIAFGNPTRNTGRFKDCFPGGKFAHRWQHRRVDARSVKRSNKEQIQEWIDDYGEDSDFVRIRVKGIHPRASSTQFIPEDLVENAMNARMIPGLFDHAPLLVGVDVARFGDDKSIILVRQGGAIKKLRKFMQIDTMKLVGHVTEDINEFNPAATFVDVVGIGAGVCDRLKQLGYDIIEVNSGERPLDEKLYHNLRAEMWGNMRDWLKTAYLPKDDELKADLCGLEYGFDDKNRFQLEKKEDMKKRGLPSPNCSDALALTFAYPVSQDAKKKDKDYKRMYYEFGPPSSMAV